jgi:PAS domain S-box-containing protein
MKERIRARHLTSSPGKQAADHLQLLVETGLQLSRERKLDVIVESALDAGLKLSGAAFGAFFYNNIGDDGSPYQLVKLAGKGTEAFSAFPLPRPTAVFAESFLHERVLRSADILKDPRYGHNSPFHGMPPNHPPVRSYLSIPVLGRTGETLGALIYGHPEPAVFSPQVESLLATIAAHAANAIDNARLNENLIREIRQTDAARQAEREAAERLVESERRLRHALDAGQLGTWSWNAATDDLDLDERAAQLFHTQPHTLIKRRHLRGRLVHPEDLAQIPEDLGEALENGGVYRADYRIRTPDGGQTWVAARGLATYQDGTSAIVGMIGTVQDVTLRKMQEATLRQSEKLAATGRLAATIAHEINNPLEAVTNLIYLCKTDPSVPDSLHHTLEAADEELARVSQIAQQTLGFYRDTAKPSQIDLSALLHGIADLFSRKLQHKRLTCKLEIDPGLHAFGLQGELRQVFSNLFVNAIDASSSGEIWIRARCRNALGREHVIVLIADQGSGIPPAIRERLFSPFFTTKESVGTGLGLWVTRGILEKHGGSITYRTRTDPPSGTVFRVRLPVEIFSPLALSSSSGFPQ